ncbi:MAG: hypothetical protein K2M84_06530, partial [Anaeroplasmataceae bacterium]|nr:hypothetical protein [Anaeroplasmataceae bacterium]
SFIVFLCSIGIAFFYKKRKKVLKTEETSQNLFNTILETSKQFLSVPASARSLEVLMEQIKDSSSNKMKKYTNILLSVFVENDMLCFADLYVVIGIPIKNIKGFEIVQEPYRFEYWHKGKDKSNLEEYGVKRITKPIRYYQANHYAVLKLNFSNKDLGVFIPAYELEEFQTILQEKRDNE